MIAEVVVDFVVVLVLVVLAFRARHDVHSALPVLSVRVDDLDVLVGQSVSVVVGAHQAVYRAPQPAHVAPQPVVVGLVLDRRVSLRHSRAGVGRLIENDVGVG